MKLSAVFDLLSHKISAAAFRQSASVELAERRQVLRVFERGRVIPVRVTEDVDMRVTAESVVALCEYFERGELDAIEIAYIVDALQLSDRASFESEVTAEYLAMLTDPEINGELSVDIVREIAREVRGHI
jgi:hypothetical protein